MNEAPKLPEQICNLCLKMRPTSLALHNATGGRIQVCAAPECRLLVTMPSVPAALQRRLIGSSY